MSYQQIGDALSNEIFLRRVNGCVVDLAAAIIAAPLAGGSIQDDALQDLTTTACKNWCLSYLKGTTIADKSIIGRFLLMNGAIAADPYGQSTGTDAAMNWQLKHSLLTLVSLG